VPECFVFVRFLVTPAPDGVGVAREAITPAISEVVAATEAAAVPTQPTNSS
jgi:hypothetical protein